MNITIKNVNQFKDQYIEQLLTSIKQIGGTLLLPTVSLCHCCYRHIPGWRYHKDNKVYLAKNCSFHGITHHMIESDYEFYSNLFYTQETKKYNFNSSLLMEGSDRCNLECPHCYHLPDNQITDIPKDQFLARIKEHPIGEDEIQRIVLSGAESTLRPDFCELVADIRSMNLYPIVMTNGIRFGDVQFSREAAAAGLIGANIGLNHPEYNNYEVVRKKQIRAIETMHQENVAVGYISYTMIDLSELDYILKEITSSTWTPNTFRVRAGSEIGRNSTEGRVYLSDIFKTARKWAEDNNKSFKVIGEADDNIYHIMVDIEGKEIRLIQWCDITDIDMEELRAGPWCDFVPDGITNFLHQIIRRDILKNQNKILPDVPPSRYMYNRNITKEPLDFSKLYADVYTRK